MILYGNKSVVAQIFQLHGSLIHSPTTVLAGAVLACLSLGCWKLMEDDSPWAPRVVHYYGIGALVSIVSFATVFRATLAWQKYWEALGEVDRLYSKWIDVFTQYSVFARTSVETGLLQGDEKGKDRADRVQALYNGVHKHFTLLSAMALDRLAHGDLEIMNRRSSTHGWRDQVTTRDKLGMELGKSDPRQHKASRGLPTFVLKEDYEPSDEWTNTYLVEELPSKAELEALEGAEDRVAMVTTWILSGLSQTSKDLEIAPPIQSRMYQELSNASLAYANCVKIADTPFPFPYSQVLVYLLMVFSISVPVIGAAASSSMPMAAFVTFFVFLSFWTINRGALDLEAPFGKDINDIPLNDFHHRFCKNLVQVHIALNVVHRGMVDGVSLAAFKFQGRTMSLFERDVGDIEISAPVVEARIAQAASSSSSKAGVHAKGHILPLCGGQQSASTPEAEPPGTGEAQPSKGAAVGASHAPVQSKLEGTPEIRLTDPAGARTGFIEKQAISSRGSASEIIDRQLIRIGEVMERHLANIGREIDDLSRRNEALRQEQASPIPTSKTTLLVENKLTQDVSPQLHKLSV